MVHSLFQPSLRTGFLLIALACVGAMGFALFAQYYMDLEPCPLCVFQRVAVIMTGLLALLGALLSPRSAGGRGLMAGLTGLASLSGAGVAAWQVRLQNLPADQVPACGPGLDYMLETMPFTDMLAKVFKGSGECAEVSWTLLGLSLPAWSLVFLIGITVFAAWLARMPRR
ncbi:disulfide bond formation protein B [Laribacter hongkongensis]|uniref:disulfide bond formation protein B n=1 Tax=Laribacter hongkongensis TaxID=168471 RepID=UPI001EFDB616|nr:disulfide bond formation protein B [Laribacter hongkongensis]MCG9058015.1 disulfide bond formation protein B [Laribacter hongkongensis]MCG9084523.1 disulfide bond formation protein B [Laribacter hongkongensis]